MIRRTQIDFSSVHRCRLVARRIDGIRERIHDSSARGHSMTNCFGVAGRQPFRHRRESPDGLSSRCEALIHLALKRFKYRRHGRAKCQLVIRCSQQKCGVDSIRANEHRSVQKCVDARLQLSERPPPSELLLTVCPPANFVSELRRAFRISEGVASEFHRKPLLHFRVASQSREPSALQKQRFGRQPA